MSGNFPVITYEPQNEYERRMQDAGFEMWAHVSVSDASFFRLLGLGVLSHCFKGSSNKELEAWKSRVDRIMIHYEDYISGKKDEDVIFWDNLKNNCLFEACKSQRFAMTSPGLSKLTAGYMPDMADEDTVKVICSGLSIVLVWYEYLSEELTTRWYYEEGTRDSLFFVCMGRSETGLYLFLHQKIFTVNDEVVADFPFYTYAGVNFQQPQIVGTNYHEQDSLPQGSLLGCLMNLLLRVLLEVPVESIRPEHQQLLAQQSQKWDSIERLIPQSFLCAGFDTAKCGEVLSRFRVRVLHTVDNCEQFPDPTQELVRVQGRTFHSACLRNYILDRMNGNAAYFVPQTQSLIPQAVIQKVAPEVFRRKR